MQRFNWSNRKTRHGTAGPDLDSISTTLTPLQYAILLPAVAEMMQEQKLSRGDALAKLREMLGPGQLPEFVCRSIERLESARDELTLLSFLGAESMRASQRKPARQR